MKKKSLKGFTLIEIIVVIGIIGVLAAILIPTMIGYVNKSKRASDVSSAREIYIKVIGVMSDEDQTDAADAFYNGGSVEYSKFDDLSKVQYDLVVVSYLDGLSGTDGSGNIWTPVDSDQQEFCDALNNSLDFKNSSNGSKIKIKSKDSNIGIMNRWFIGYRKSDPQTIEIWVGDANLGASCGTPLMCLYTQINKSSNPTADG
ncbi:MAG: prepilin-type N-terminal cleavage/methylation domain-containing protein [Ruminococcus sp.]|nr:prepilin-type N-terminal cleavage/methylation domain-containing protein [Ruminococcus sp.]